MDRFHEDILFDTILCDEPVDSNISGLTDTMTSILGLFIHCRIPISIIEDYIAGSCQVETNTT